MSSEKRMCFGSWPVKVEMQMLMILEPGGIQIDVEAIAGNESVHIIHAQLRVLCSQGCKRDAWGGLHCFQDLYQGFVGNRALKKVVL